MKQLIQITSGNGPEECNWVVAQVLKAILKDAECANLTTRIMHKINGDQNGTVKTTAILLEGKRLPAFLDSWVGTIKWIGQSPYRKMHKRKNWFVGVFLLEHNPDSQRLHEKDLKYETYRSGGPGGQHVNKVNTAVRIIHQPSGITATASSERSQARNKAVARQKIADKLAAVNAQNLADKARASWQNQQLLERGNAVRTFEGTGFRSGETKEKYRDNRKTEKQKLIKWKEN